MRRSLSLSVQFVTLVGLTILFFNANSGADPRIIWLCLGVVYAVIVASIMRPVRIVPQISTYMKIDLLFAVFFYVVFFQPYQLAVLGWQDLRDSTFLTYTFAEESNRAVILATIGLLAFNIGFHLRKGDGWHSPSVSIPTADEQLRYGELDKLVPMALFALCAIYLATGMRSSGEGRYTGTDAGGSAADGISLLISMLTIITIGLICARRAQSVRPHGMLWFGLLVGASWAVRVLLLGDRNTFLLFAVALIGGALTYFFQAGRLVLLGLIVGAFVLYNVVEYARMATNPTIDQLLSAAFNARSAKTGAEGSDNSFNITTVSVRAGLYAVPALFDYGGGYYKLLGFAGIVPLVRGFLFDPNTQFATTTDVLTQVMIGPNRGWSVGTNVIMDSYIDFGVLGVVAVLATVGLLAGWAQNAAHGNPASTQVTVFYLLSMTMFAQLPRYAIDFPVRAFVWTALIFGVYRLLSPRSRRASHLRNAPFKSRSQKTGTEK